MAKDVIIACDFPSKAKTLKFLNLFEGQACKPFVKIGMELFYAEGPDIVREIKERGHKIFLDLKLHDIPNTVEKAMASLSRLGVDMTNVHAAGGCKMMEAAIRGLTKEDGSRPILIAVTQLTSTDSHMLHKELGISWDMEDTVINYAKNAKEAGLDGVVCSAREAGMIHDAVGIDFQTITPGIRFADSAKDDQHRVVSPADARLIGSDYIVVGRPITQADDPVKAYARCCKDFLNE